MARTRNKTLDGIRRRRLHVAQLQGPEAVAALAKERAAERKAKRLADGFSDDRPAWAWALLSACNGDVDRYLAVLDVVHRNRAAVHSVGDLGDAALLVSSVLKDYDYGRAIDPIPHRLLEINQELCVAMQARLCAAESAIQGH